MINVTTTILLAYIELYVNSALQLNEFKLLVKSDDTGARHIPMGLMLIGTMDLIIFLVFQTRLELKKTSPSMEALANEQNSNGGIFKKSLKVN